MKKSIAIIVMINLLLLPVTTGRAHAYWVWTPETKKFINPKYAVKDTPKEQYDWAMSFYDSKDYKGSAMEFEKLVKNYEYSEYAAKSQYYVGLSYENQGKYYIAFQNYQKAIDNFPHLENISEIIARQFNIGNIYAEKKNPKVLGADIMTSFDRAIEIYKKVVDNEPFGKLADEAQFKMAMAMKEAGNFDEATLAFQKIIDDYPTSKLFEQARYEMANSAYRASLQPAYDAAPTDKALKAFEEFANTNKDENLTKEAQQTIQRLKNKAADKSFNTAEFYEGLKRYESAIIYYQDVINTYPDSADAEIAKVRIADLKSGNYSHRKNYNSSGRKQAWIMPWTGKDKKASEVVMKSSPDAAGDSQVQAVNDAASVNPDESAKQAKSKKAWWSFGLDKKRAAVKTASEVQVNSDVGKTCAKKTWWSFGFGKKSSDAKTAPVAVKKAWAPLNFDKDKKEMKKENVAQQVSKPVDVVQTSAQAPQSKSKKAWWSFGLSKKKADDVRAEPVADVKKTWTPLNFDKKPETKKDE